MKTIRQIADEIGVSKQAVQQRLNKPPLVDTAKPLLTMVDGAWRVPPEAESLILAVFSDTPTSSPTTLADKQPTTLADKQPTTLVGELVGELVGMLQEELRLKNEQIASQQQIMQEQSKSIQELTAALENTTASLQAAQALHAGTIQQRLTEPATSEAEAVKTEPKEVPEGEAATDHQVPDRRRGFDWWPFGKKK